jgi:hypothetical protein
MAFHSFATGMQPRKLPTFHSRTMEAEQRHYLTFFCAPIGSVLTSSVANLCALIPGLNDISIDTPNPADRQIIFHLENDVILPGDRVSDGVKICTFFAALTWHPRPPKTILVEEPENGIHPKMLAEVVDLLRGLSVGKIGPHACQVIVTTHSPYLLDCIDPKTEQVLVFRREADGNRTVDKPDMDKLQVWLDEDFGLGEIWSNEKEDGLIERSEG